jgi:hypothetical protein
VSWYAGDARRARRFLRSTPGETDGLFPTPLAARRPRTMGAELELAVDLTLLMPAVRLAADERSFRAGGTDLTPLPPSLGGKGGS